MVLDFLYLMKIAHIQVRSLQDIIKTEAKY